MTEDTWSCEDKTVHSSVSEDELEEGFCIGFLILYGFRIPEEGVVESCCSTDEGIEHTEGHWFTCLLREACIDPALFFLNYLLELLVAIHFARAEDVLIHPLLFDTKPEQSHIVFSKTLLWWNMTPTVQQAGQLQNCRFDCSSVCHMRF